MSLQDTPGSERTHIAFFGMRNAGKSSLVNAVTGQAMAIVSDQKGTTTDPVTKSMELLPIGPVVIIDTPGFDDEGELGGLRIKRTLRTLSRTDLAVLVLDGTEEVSEGDCELIGLFRKKSIPYLVAVNKSDLTEMQPQAENTAGRSGESDSSVNRNAAAIRRDLHRTGFAPENDTLCRGILAVSALERRGIEELKEQLGQMRGLLPEKQFMEGLVHPGDLVVLVIPIDKAAPKGRLILPEQMAARAVLDAGGRAVLTQDDRLTETLAELKRPPSLVVTDSQVFKKVSQTVPAEIPLTSFSILMAEYKGFLAQAVRGVKVLDSIFDGDRILISEGCTHHRQCGDIGTVKLPALIRRYTGRQPEFIFSSGKEFPEDLSACRLVIHCGGCMVNEREMQFRRETAEEQQIPLTNYGTAIAYMNGILERSLEAVYG